MSPIWINGLKSNYVLMTAPEKSGVYFCAVTAYIIRKGDKYGRWLDR